MTTETQGGQRTEPAHRLGAASISQDLGFLLAKLHAAGSVLNNRALAAFDLKERSYSILILANSGLEPTQREMADFLSLDPSQIVALVDELEKRGLVVRAPGNRTAGRRLSPLPAKGKSCCRRPRRRLSGQRRRRSAACPPTNRHNSRPCFRRPSGVQNGVNDRCQQSGSSGWGPPWHSALLRRANSAMTTGPTSPAWFGPELVALFLTKPARTSSSSVGTEESDA